MKTKTLFAFVTSFCAVLCAPGLQAFEGRVNLTITNTERSDQPRNLTLLIKGELLRTDFTPPAGPRGREVGPTATIIDHSKHEVSILFLQRKTYMVHPLSGKMREKISENLTTDIFKSTGRREKIAGVDAEEYVGASDEKRYTEVWVTKEMGKYLLASQGMGETANTGGLTAQALWAQFAYTKDFFVLRAIEREGKNGPEKFRLEVTKIDRASQDDSLFKVPSDFKKIEPRGMMHDPGDVDMME